MRQTLLGLGARLFIFMRRLQILVGGFSGFPQMLHHGPGQLRGIGRSPWGPCEGAV